MGINLNTTNTQNFFKTGVVSGQELQQVSSKILSQATAVETSNISKFNFNNAKQVDAGLKLVGANAQVNSEVSRQISGIDMNLSAKASTAINNLNAQAAIMSAKNVTSNVNGNIFVPSEKGEISDMKSVFATNNNIDFKKALNLDKDKKGQGGLFNFSQGQNQEKKDDSLDLMI